MKELIGIIKKGLICMLLGGASGLLLNMLIMMSPLPDLFPAYGEMIADRLYSVDIISGIFLYCLAAPILEEFIFRIGLYGIIGSFIGSFPAALISSLLFGLYHMNMLQGIYAFIMGILFCTMYRRDHRKFVPICMHIGANLAVWTLSNIFLGHT